MSPADRLLAAARAATTDRPTGVARAGACVVTYWRARNVGPAATTCPYDVGTEATIIAYGMRSRVLPYIEAIFAGNVTRAACDAWIAATPARVAAAKATGARLPAGTVRA